MDGFVCPVCQMHFPFGRFQRACQCGSPLDIISSYRFDPRDIITQDLSLWRYRKTIPFLKNTDIVSFQEGMSPLLEIDFERKPVWFKQEQCLPTGSFKDRGASVLISYAKSLGVKEVVMDSSGNAGASVAAYCARAGILCSVMVPEGTSPEKLNQIRVYGARLTVVPGDREDTARAAIKKARSLFYASHYWNPFFFQGTKTIAYEICEQMGWESPDAVLLPVGNGSLLLGIAIGFDELVNARVIARKPRLIAIQSERCNPLSRQFLGKKSLPDNRLRKKGLAEGIAIADPLRGTQIINAVRGSYGQIWSVNEKEIKMAHKEIGALGFFIEPTSAVAVAGVKKYMAMSPPDEKIVSLFTGNGLKSQMKVSGKSK